MPALRGRIELRDVKLFVSSPGDVAPERGRVEAVVAKLNRDYDGIARFVPILWEEHYYKADSTFQTQIPEAVACDIVVSIFWTRIGTELPPDFVRMPDGRPYPSGTAYELLTALERSKAEGVPDVYVFRKTADAALPTTDAERRRQAQTQLDALEAFWSEWFRTEKRPVQGGVSDLRRPRRLRSSRSKRCCGNGSRRVVCSARVSRGRRRRARRSADWRRSRPSTRRCSSAATA